MEDRPKLMVRAEGNKSGLSKGSRKRRHSHSPVQSVGGQIRVHRDNRRDLESELVRAATQEQLPIESGKYKRGSRAQEVRGTHSTQRRARESRVQGEGVATLRRDSGQSSQVMRETKSFGAKKRSPLSPETMRIRYRLGEWEKSGRKHWDLFRYLYNPFVLLDATRLVIQNAGSAGLDGKTCEQMRGHEWEVVQSLIKRLKARRYAVSAVRRVYIPKREGRERPLGIPNVEDRIIQRALVLLLEPIYEQVFLPCSWGFRPNRKSVDCVYHVSKATYRFRHVLDADIESFFDKVQHRKLIGMLKERIVDKRIHDLIKAFLKSGFKEYGKPWLPSEIGTPQGGPLSPMLANIYLHYVLDAKFAELHTKTAELFRFADDFVIVAKSEQELKILKKMIEGWLYEAGLNLKDTKTRLVDMRDESRSHESNFTFLGYHLHLRSFSDNRARFWIARQPSQKARQEFHHKLKEKLKPHLRMEEAQEILFVGNTAAREDHGATQL